MSLLSMVVGLQEAGVRFVLVGGLAATAHGASRVTDDLDICYDRERDNLEQLATLLASWNAYPREMEPGLPFFMDARTLRNTSILTLRTRQGDIDLLDRVEGVGDYNACLEASERLTIGSEDIRVLKLDALISAKKTAARPKDFEHLQELEAIQALRRHDENL